MKIANWLFGFLALLVLPLALLFAGVGFWVFVDLASALIVLILGPSLGFFSFGLPGLARAYRTAIQGGSEADLAFSLAVFKSQKQTLFHIGLFCFLLGLIAMLSNVADTGSIVRGVAITLLALLYAMVLNLYCIQPFLGNCEAQLAELQTIKKV